MGMIEDSWIGNYYEGLSPRQKAGLAKYGGVAKRGFMEAWGFEYHADNIVGGARGAELAREQGIKAIQAYHRAPGKWRFMGLGGDAGRINMYKALRKEMGVGKAAWKALPGHTLFVGAFTAYAMYEGYKKDGLWGAAKGGVHAAAEWIAFDTVMTALGSVAAPLEVAAIGVGAGYGVYKMLDYGAKRAKQSRKLEFGGHQIEDQFGTIATMRQRSLQEMQRSHGNLRGSLGTEASYFNV